MLRSDSSIENSDPSSGPEIARILGGFILRDILVNSPLSRTIKCCAAREMNLLCSSGVSWTANDFAVQQRRFLDSKRFCYVAAASSWGASPPIIGRKDFGSP